jgi:hydroxymethylbilane synthase
MDSKQNKHIVIGSRGSDLALWQAHFLQNELLQIGFTSSISIIKTQGDKIQHLSLEKLEGKGFFTKEIEDALLQGTIDVAVHSHKDLPTTYTPGLTIAAVSHREAPSELLLIRKEKVNTLNDLHLAENAIVGTSSSRRNVQLKFFRPDITCTDIRGNVPTRIKKLRDGLYDAILLANAGVTRLQLPIDDLHAVKINPEKFIPAPAQGVLAFQCRKQDYEMLEILAKINHADVADTIFVERKVMNLFNGGCHMPLGVYCRKENNEYLVWATQTADKTTPISRMFVRGNNTDMLANQIFNELQKKSDKKVFVSTEMSEQLLATQVLRQKGLQLTAVPCVEIEAIDFTFDITCDWLFFTSKNGVAHFFNKYPVIADTIRFACIGEATAAQLNAFGKNADFIGEGNTQNIANQFQQFANGCSVVFAAAQNRQTPLQEMIAAYANVHHIAVYANQPKAIGTVSADVLVFTSPLNVDGFLLSNEITSTQKIIAIGATTQQYLLDKGYPQVSIPPQHHLLSVAELICGLV